VVKVLTKQGNPVFNKRVEMNGVKNIIIGVKNSHIKIKKQHMDTGQSKNTSLY